MPRDGKVAPRFQTASELPAPRLSEAVLRGVPCLTDEALFQACGTRVMFTGRAGGVSDGPYQGLNLGTHVDDDPARVGENRRRLVAALANGALVAGLLVPNQVHKDHVALVDGCTAGAEDTPAAAAVARELSEGADAVVCVDAARPVCLCFADCVPVVLVAPGGAFAIAHAGWRGALASIPAKTAACLAQVAGVEPRSLHAYIGPHIGGCSYEVSPELLDRFKRRFGAACDAGGGRLSLSVAVRQSLDEAGLDDADVFDAVSDSSGSNCTFCNPGVYYSYRADNGVTGRNGAAACRIPLT